LRQFLSQVRLCSNVHLGNEGTLMENKTNISLEIVYTDSDVYGFRQNEHPNQARQRVEDMTKLLDYLEENQLPPSLEEQQADKDKLTARLMKQDKLNPQLGIVDELTGNPHILQYGLLTIGALTPLLIAVINARSARKIAVTRSNGDKFEFMGLSPRKAKEAIELLKEEDEDKNNKEE